VKWFTSREKLVKNWQKFVPIEFVHDRELILQCAQIDTKCVNPSSLPKGCFKDRNILFRAVHVGYYHNIIPVELTKDKSFILEMVGTPGFDYIFGYLTDPELKTDEEFLRKTLPHTKNGFQFCPSIITNRSFVKEMITHNGNLYHRLPLSIQRIRMWCWKQLKMGTGT